MTALVCALFATVGPPVVEGRVLESGGGGVASAQVTLSQGSRTQVLRTGTDGGFRFRAFEGDGVVSVRLPQGWTAAGDLSHAFGPALRGDVIRANFSVRARRVLRGRLLVGGQPFANAAVQSGRLSAQTDAQGLFMLEGLPAGVSELRVDTPPMAGRVELPPGPVDVSRDVPLGVAEFASLPVRPVAQDPVRRAISDWVASKPMKKREIASMERLAALANLDAGFRLVMGVAPKDLARGAVAAAMLQRYLTGPALVPRERVLFSQMQFAKPGQLELILARTNEPEIH